MLVKERKMRNALSDFIRHYLYLCFAVSKYNWNRCLHLLPGVKEQKQLICFGYIGLNGNIDYTS